jgi:ABC-2 type transport system ATP-binding protein
MTTVIDVANVSKTFKLHHERNQSLKERLLHPRAGRTEIFQALEDISFTVNAGETVGIVGHNGSGKSTLLKCICGVLQPTSGSISLRGNLAALLELGAGFQVELSGRDNVYLYGTMLGFSKKRIEQIFDEIVAFSEIEHFIDTQVKFYSSGMYVRLAFAVAVNVNPDILVVDEVLAVGDERFQAKCIDRIRRFQQEGRAILLVTHSADQVRALCDRAVVLDGGRMLANGDVADSLRIFRDALMQETIAHQSEGEAASIVVGAVTTPNGSFDVATGGSMRFEVQLTSETAYSGNFVMEIYSRDGVLICRTDRQGSPVNLRPGHNLVSVELPNIPLLDGVFDINVGITDERGSNVKAWSEKVATMQVTYGGREGGLVELGALIRQA